MLCGDVGVQSSLIELQKKADDSSSTGEIHSMRAKINAFSQVCVRARVC